MTESEQKYKVFAENDLTNNNGLIVNQYGEIKSLMESDAEYKFFQENKLYDLLSFATNHTQFYRSYSGFKSMTDFPVMSKQTIKEHEDELMSNIFASDSKNVKQQTSGSTGTPFSVTWDHRKHCRLIADMKYFAHLGGVESHERIVCIHAFRKMSNSSAEKQERDNVYNIYYSLLDDESVHDLLAQAESYKPVMIIAYGSMWDAVADYIAKGKAETFSFNLKAVISEAEYLNKRTRSILKEYFGCGIYSRYGNMECGVMAQEDESGYGHRLNTASYYFEFLNPESDEPVEDGEIGRIVLTDLSNLAMPLIRYDTGDMGIHRVVDGKEYLAELIGRKNDVLYTTSGTLVNQHHIVIFSSLFQDIKKFQFVQESEKKYVCLLVTDNHSYEEHLLDEFRNTFGQDGEYSIQYVDEIKPLPSGKYQMTVCKLGK